MREGTQSPTAPEPASGLLKAVAVVLYAIDVVLVGVEKYAHGVVNNAELLGAILAPIIFAILFVMIARGFKWVTSPRGTAKVVVGTMAVFAMGSCGGLLTVASASQRAPAEAAARLAKATVARVGYMPKKVDSLTTLRGVEAHGDTLVYYYQLLMTRADFPRSQVDAFRTQLIGRVCGDTTLRSQSVGQGVIVRYRYADMYDYELTSIYVTEAVCGGAQ